MWCGRHVDLMMSQDSCVKTALMERCSGCDVGGMHAGLIDSLTGVNCTGGKVQRIWYAWKSCRSE